MPRDNDKNNDSRGRRDRPSGGKGRSGVARGPDKKFAKRGFAGKSGDGERRPYAGKPDGAKSYGKKPYAGPGKPYAGKREGPPPRRDYGDAPRPARFNRDDRPDRGPRKDFRPRDDRGGDKRPYTPREGGDKRPYTPRGEGFRKDGDRPERKFGGDKKFSRGAPDRGPRKSFGDRPDRGEDFGTDRGESKPWQKRDASSPDHMGRNSRPPRDGARNIDRSN